MSGMRTNGLWIVIMGPLPDEAGGIADVRNPNCQEAASHV